jgi:hypothetical protein
MDTTRYYFNLTLTVVQCGMILIMGERETHYLSEERGLIPVLPVSADEQWSSHDTLSLPSYGGERERCMPRLWS